MLRTGDEPIIGYRLDNFLGRGQFGDVWQAQAPGGKLVALKFINIVGKQGLKEYRAIQKVKNIQHPHLMPIIAFWILDQEQNVLSDEVLEQIDLSAQGKEVDIRKTQMGEEPMPTTLVVAMLLGEASLNDYFEQCREEGKNGIPVEQLLDYMEEAAKGIDFLNRPCHDLGEGPVAIQHCDIKPHNMLLTGGSVQICDFGLARVLEDVRQTRSVAGTPAYIAPESISGRRPSSSTDQYSLAITYYEMRTGDLPFRAEDRTSQMAIMQAHMNGQLEFSLVGQFEADVLRKATDVEPEKRYPTSLAMVRALRRAVEQQERGPVENKGTMVTGDHIAPAPSDMSDADVFQRTEVTDDVAPSGQTLNSGQFDGTMQVSPNQVEQLQRESLPSETVAEASQTTVEDEEAPAARQDFRQPKRSSSSVVPLVTIAVLLLAVAVGGGFMWWQSRPDPSGGGGGVTGEAVVKDVTFVPADVTVTIRGEPVSLSNGTVEVTKPDSGRLDLYVSHSSGHFTPKEVFSWAELERFGYKVELELNAEGYVAKSWQALDEGEFDQAVADFRHAIDQNRSLAKAPPPIWLRGHKEYVIDLATDNAGNWLGSVSEDSNGKNVFVWDLQSGQVPESTALKGHGDVVEAVAISPDGKWLATGSFGGELNLWRLGKLEKGPLKLDGPGADVTRLAFDSSSRYLAATAREREVRVWELNEQNQDLAPAYVLDAHVGNEGVPALAFVPDTYELITGGNDNQVFHWRLPPPGQTGNIEPIAMTHDGEATDVGVVAVDPHGKWVAAGTNSALVLWDINKPNDGYSIVTRNMTFPAVAFSPDGKFVAAGDEEGRIFLCEFKPDGLPDRVTPVARPGGGGDPRAHAGTVLTLAFTPDGKWLASGGGDKLIHFWDIAAFANENGANPPPVTLSGHEGKVQELLFTPTNHWLISGSDDGNIGLWDYRKWLVVDRALRTDSTDPRPSTFTRREPLLLPPLAASY